MTQRDTIKAAIVDLLETMGAVPETPISLYAVGPPLVDKGFSQHEVVDALWALERDKIIDMLDGNRLRVKSIPLARPKGERGG